MTNEPTFMTIMPRRTANWLSVPLLLIVATVYAFLATVQFDYIEPAVLIGYAGGGLLSGFVISLIVTCVIQAFQRGAFATYLLPLSAVFSAGCAYLTGYGLHVW